MNTVVLDGQGQVNIGDSVSVQIVTAESSGQVDIYADGEAGLLLTETADADLEIVEDGEAGVFFDAGAGDMPYYTGPTEITPTEETQTLRTADRAISKNIIINPIPSNYGRITWDGRTLTVS